MELETFVFWGGSKEGMWKGLKYVCCRFDLAQSFVCILIWVKLHVLDVLLEKKKKGKIAVKLQSNWEGFWKWGSAFQKHRPSFLNWPSRPWSCPDCCEWDPADTDGPHFMCLLPSHPFCFLFPLLFPHRIFQKAFLSFILYTANHTLTHMHTHTHTHTSQPPPSTTGWFSISKGHRQPSLSLGSRWHCLAPSLGLAPPGHRFPCGLVHGPSFAQVHSSLPMGGSKQRPQF